MVEEAKALAKKKRASNRERGKRVERLGVQILKDLGADVEPSGNRMRWVRGRFIPVPHDFFGVFDAWAVHNNVQRLIQFHKLPDPGEKTGGSAAVRQKAMEEIAPRFIGTEVSKRAVSIEMWVYYPGNARKSQRKERGFEVRALHLAGEYRVWEIVDPNWPNRAVQDQAEEE